MRKFLSVISAFFVETISLPGLARSTSKLISSFFGFLVSFAKSVMVAVLTDPLMFMLVGGILLYVYMDEFLSKFQ